ncbi:hypothetical protein PHYBLDRAFT_170212 [Phycomyces blakesleeanus NRRL 1555(-)]|uniref:Uncharacterized protein n=1 Tax=Phycomyces blakesleeanus (strain ATCC 8743b / DSM 1359 / FGSC 10004 / NBRC 33097 / NRRL 1555) TaxID=763407 RepID=A0A162TWL4_PHYB8|nr:hypothetical protein PHYBLDRAFT_170212 [Phycomyces blakesleeanus NRRL 1555(-)]OAD71552.1 hypothetical protein PHYBLDRAFT_170212 [Phycomyces blakesleeanus NRRL 1555(-)]|eukprot:XP_018289592.1 hypothetical protein PHYBLDRAFT_170212 [Phycomyces blakesleeanus NRRL 1555(-)]
MTTVTSSINNKNQQFGYNAIIDDIQTSYKNAAVLSIDDFVQSEDIELPTTGHKQNLYNEFPKELLKLLPESMPVPQETHELVCAYLQQIKELPNLQSQAAQALEIVQNTQVILSQTTNSIDASSPSDDA